MNAKTRECAEHILTKSQIFSIRRWWFLSQLQSCLNASQINLLQGEDLTKTFPEKWQRHIKQSVHPTFSIFLLLIFISRKKEICFCMEDIWFYRTKVGLVVCLVSHSLPVLWIAHLAAVIVVFEEAKTEHASYVVGSGDCGLGLHVVRGECS